MLWELECSGDGLTPHFHSHPIHTCEDIKITSTDKINAVDIIE